MKQHPTKGEHILDAVPLLKEKAGDGLMHHENVDGSGYPRGLRGDGHPAARPDRQRGRRLRRDDHRPAVLEGDDLRGSDRTAEVPGRARSSTRSCVDAFERAFLTGDVSPAKARRASVASRHFDLNALIGEARPAPASPATPRRRSRPRRLRRPRCENDEPATRPARTRRRSRCCALAAARRRRAEPRRRGAALLDRRHAPARGTRRPRARGVQEGGQGGPEEPVLPEGLGLAYAAKRDWRRGDRRLPQGARAQPATTSTCATTSGRAHRVGRPRGGQEGVPRRVSRPDEPDARDLGPQPRARRYLEEKNYAEADQLVPDERQPQQGVPRALPGLAETLVAVGRLDEAVAQLEAGVQEVPSDARAAARARPGAARRPGASPRRARGSRRRCARTTRGGAVGRAAADQLKTLPK